MRSEDLSQVLLMERNAHISPWARLSFEESLNRGDVCRVIEVNNEIIAYHVCSPVLDELHILNVVSAPSLQGVGLGHRLMQDILDAAQAAQLTKVFLEVRRSNEAAQSLYLKWQFKQIAIRKNYYRIPDQKSPAREDALVFVRQFS